MFTFRDSEGHAQLQAYSRAIEDLEGRLRQLSDDVKTTALQSANEAIDKLEIAMCKAYKVAVMIPGDYDNLNGDQAMRKDIVRQVVAAFQDASDRASGGLDRIGALHSQAIEIQNELLLSLKNAITESNERKKLEMEDLRKQLSTIEGTTSTYLSIIQEQNRNVNRLFEEMNREPQGLDSFHLIFSDPSKLNIDTSHIRQKYDEARAHEEEARRTYEKHRGMEAELRQRHAFLDAQLIEETQLRNRIPLIEMKASDLINHSRLFQDQFVSLKDAFSRLALRADELESALNSSGSVTSTKDLFATLLLQIAKDAVLDSRLTDEARMIKDEIFGGYGTAAPEEVAAAGLEVDEKLKIFDNIPSITAAA